MNPSRQIKNPVADLLDASSDAKSFLRAANNAAMRESLEVSIGVSGYLLTQQSATSGGLWGPMDGSAIMFVGGGDIRLTANTVQTAERTIVAAFNDVN